MSPTIQTLPSSFLLFLSYFSSFLRARTRSPTTSYPFLCPGVSSDAALPATPPYSTHYATLDYTNFRLSLSVFTLLHSIPFSRLLSVSSCPSCLGLSYFHLCLALSWSRSHLQRSFVSLAPLHRGMHDRHSGERITRTAFTQSTMFVPTV